MLIEFYHHKIKPRLPAYAFNKHYWLFLLWGPVVSVWISLGFWSIVLLLCEWYIEAKCIYGVTYGISTDLIIAFLYSCISIFFWMTCDLLILACFLIWPKFMKTGIAFIYFSITILFYAWFQYVGERFSGGSLENARDYFYALAVFMDFTVYACYRFIIWGIFVRKQ